MSATESDDEIGNIQEIFSLFCYRCGHSWFSRDRDFPKRCPRCHSSRWDRPVKKSCKCRFCGNEWNLSKIDEECPECGASRLIGITDRSLHCNQCDHDWIQRSEGQPGTCPLCRSADWHMPKHERAVCTRCSHIWRKRAKDPKKCPSCQSPHWNEPKDRIRCQRCGHSWMLNKGRRAEDVIMCPSCKSRKWNEAPKTYECEKCGRKYILRSNSREGKCPKCDPYHIKEEMTCHLCGEDWSAVASGKGMMCPKCGSKAELKNNRDISSMTIWSDGRRMLKYITEKEFGYVYLMHDRKPVSTIYFHRMCSNLGISAEQFINAVNDGSMERTWKELADLMFRDRNEYKKRIRYFMKRLSLSETDAEYLAIHFTGMGPTAIAIRFGVPYNDVRASFDRIMAAFADSGIVVDDTVYTEDPFFYY